MELKTLTQEDLEIHEGKVEAMAALREAARFAAWMFEAPIRVSIGDQSFELPAGVRPGFPARADDMRNPKG